MNCLEEQQSAAWVMAPESNEWIAQDKNGIWWSYQEKPILKAQQYAPANLDFHYLTHDKVNGDWVNTLQNRADKSIVCAANKTNTCKQESLVV